MQDPLAKALAGPKAFKTSLARIRVRSSANRPRCELALRATARHLLLHVSAVGQIVSTRLLLPIAACRTPQRAPVARS